MESASTYQYLVNYTQYVSFCNSCYFIQSWGSIGRSLFTKYTESSKEEKHYMFWECFNVFFLKKELQREHEWQERERNSIILYAPTWMPQSGTWVIFSCLPRNTGINWSRSRTAKTWISPQMGCQLCKSWLNPLCHNSSPRNTTLGSHVDMRPREVWYWYWDLQFWELLKQPHFH